MHYSRPPNVSRRVETSIKIGRILALNSQKCNYGYKLAIVRNFILYHTVMRINTASFPLRLIPIIINNNTILWNKTKTPRLQITMNISIRHTTYFCSLLGLSVSVRACGKLNSNQNLLLYASHSLFLSMSFSLSLTTHTLNGERFSFPISFNTSI